VRGTVKGGPALRASVFIYNFRGAALGLLLGTSFASAKRIVRGIVKGGPALRASMFINEHRRAERIARPKIRF